MTSENGLQLCNLVYYTLFRIYMLLLHALQRCNKSVRNIFQKFCFDVSNSIWWICPSTTKTSAIWYFQKQLTNNQSTKALSFCLTVFVWCDFSLGWVVQCYCCSARPPTNLLRGNIEVLHTQVDLLVDVDAGDDEEDAGSACPAGQKTPKTEYHCPLVLLYTGLWTSNRLIFSSGATL